MRVRLYSRIAELRVGLATDASDIELDVIFVVGDLQTGQQRRQVDEVPQSQGIELALGGGNRRARIALQRLRDALDRDDDLLERLLPRLCLGRLLGEKNGRRTEQGASDGSRQRPENSHFLVPLLTDCWARRTAGEQSKVRPTDRARDLRTVIS